MVWTLQGVGPTVCSGRAELKDEAVILGRNGHYGRDRIVLEVWSGRSTNTLSPSQWGHYCLHWSEDQVSLNFFFFLSFFLFGLFHVLLLLVLTKWRGEKKKNLISRLFGGLITNWLLVFVGMELWVEWRRKLDQVFSVTTMEEAESIRKTKKLLLGFLIVYWWVLFNYPL